MKTIDFKSTGTARVLIGILLLLLGAELISTVLGGFMAVWMETRNIAYLSTFSGRLDALVMASLFIFVAAGIVFVVWVYNLHKDLALLYPEYPITPGGALRRILIPIYNLLGFWDIFKNITSHFEEESQEMQRSARTIISLVSAMYAIGIASNIMGKIVSNWSEDDYGTAYFAVMSLSYGVDALLTIVWLKLVMMFRQIFTEKVQTFGSVLKHPIQGYTIVSEGAGRSVE